MGIYDRDYYRREGPSFLGSLTERGLMCKWVIGITVVCFIIQMLTRSPNVPQPRLGPDGKWVYDARPYREPFTDALLFDLDKVKQGEVWRLLTCAFLHDTGAGAPWHLIFNMLVLWFFGRQVEDRRGPREFLAFYLVSAVVASLVYMAAAMLGLQGGRALGASGAVTAVLLLSACYNPRQVVLLFFILPVPIWGVVAFMVLKDFFTLFGKTDETIGAAAHLGGAAFGLLYYQSGMSLTSWLPSGRARGARGAGSPRPYREEEDERAPAPVSAPVAPSVPTEHLEAQMDAILEKISRVGKENLTESERQVLIQASEILRRRKR